MATLWRSGKPVDGIGHPSALEALPTLDDALAPKSKGGRRQGEHGHGGVQGGGALGPRWWTRVLPLVRLALARGQWLQHPLALVAIGQ